MAAMLRIPALVSVFAAVVVSVLPGLAQAAEPTPLCIYEGRSFSEGAHVCAQASMVLTCSIVSDRPVWKVVTDRDVSRLCVTPSPREGMSHRERRHIARRSPPAPAIQPDPPATGSAKCFVFNGKRFCE